MKNSGKVRIGIFDLEIVGGGFGANKSTLFSFGRCTLGAKNWKVTTLPIDYPKEFAKDHLNDKPLVEEIHEFFDNHDIVVAHFGQYFDLPYVRSKMLEHNMRPIREPYFIDTWKIAKRRMKLSSNSLDALIDFLDIPHKKTHFSVKLWRRAEHGDKVGAKYIHDHCLIDVKALEKVVIRLYDLMWDIPVGFNVEDSSDGCQSKGCNGKLIGKGNRRTKTHEYKRYVCGKCGQHHRGPRKRWAY